ncbi:uncharacterized protein LOC106087280 [Stomoxys calcitrans]|uniref:uncharacterized protein LOC106087280 n=1 Tax=Stomoxys calcitrans TaxID=35570 RepID=UPI0027E239E4|nr:uncharacterized protein LOC106087280 [Stomoxys calcitrans]
MSNDKQQNEKASDDKATAAPTPIPAWVEPSLFEPVIRQKFPELKQIKDFKAIPALAAGENFATLMLRLTAEIELKDGSSKNVSLMLKTAFDIDIFKQMVQFHDIFTVESDVYKEVIPELEDMYRATGVEVKFGPNSYELTTDQPYILLEDLSTRGFKNMNRLEGLDQEHVLAALTKLAQWHAASAVRVANKGLYKTTIGREKMKEGAEVMLKGMFDNMFTPFLKCATSYEGVEDFYEAMKAKSENMVEHFIKQTESEKQGFCVLNHGDMWSNNVMFQHDAFGNIKETYFVDFQLPRYGSPVQDLYYFLLSSSKYEIKLASFDYFIKYYHDCLVQNLTLLNYSKKVPTLRDLHIMMYQGGIWGFVTVTGVMCAVLLDPNEDARGENLFANTEVAKSLQAQMYGNARYRKHAEALLPWLYDRGAF